MASRSRPRLCVLKFGGTSVGDAERIRRAARRVAGTARRERTVVVVSAMAGTTNLLLESARSAATDDYAWQDAAERIRRRHSEAARALLPPAEQARFAERLEESLGIFENICRGFALVDEATPRGLDGVASLGEVISSELFAARLRSSGIRAEAIDAARLIVTDDRHREANVLIEATESRLRRRLLPLLERGVLPVVTGFRGATLAGVPTTLGRGSSDYTSTLIGALLGADEVTIWTDVDGVMTADPRLVPGARVIPRLSYGEAIELAFFGAKVIHWKAILPVMERGVPMRVRNSFCSARPGTLIGSETAGCSAVAAVTAVPRVRLVTVRGDHSLGPVDLATRVLGWLGATGVHPLLLVQSSAESSLAFALKHEEAPALAGLAHQLSLRHGRNGLVLHSSEEVGLVTAIGAQIRHPTGVTARIFSALARRRVHVLAAANGPSGQGMALAVPPTLLGAAVNAIHREFRL
jgi:aspartokinase/homoserine dehydrogenase 1